MKKIWTALFKQDFDTHLEVNHLKSLQISGYLAEDMTFSLMRMHGGLANGNRFCKR